MPDSDPSIRPEGLTDIPSHFGPKETMDRLEEEIRNKGMKVFARIDHAAGAAEIGMTLQSTELIIFGNARGGTPLMQSAQTAGIDLPLKALVWQDAAGETWISYNQAEWIAQRHGIINADATVTKMASLLNAVARTAADSRVITYRT